MNTDAADIHLLAAPYALDAIDEFERRRFEDHLDECDTCREEVAGYLAVAAEIGAAEETHVSDDLRDAVLAVPDTVRQVGPPIRVVRAGGLTRALSVAAAAVATVAAVGLGALVANQADRIDDLERDAAVAAVLEQPDATIATLEQDGQLVRVVSSATSGDAAVVAAGLDQLDDDLVYQLWTITDDDAPAPAGFLEVGDDGHGGQVLASGLGDVDALAISIEPSGGSPAPTTTPIAVVPLTEA